MVAVLVMAMVVMLEVVDQVVKEVQTIGVVTKMVEAAVELVDTKEMVVEEKIISMVLENTVQQVVVEQECMVEQVEEEVVDNRDNLDGDLVEVEHQVVKQHQLPTETAVKLDVEVATVVVEVEEKKVIKTMVLDHQV